MKNENTPTFSIGFLELLGLAFIILKLCKVINWPWVWVLAPIWISFIIVVVLFIVLVVVNKQDYKREQKEFRKYYTSLNKDKDDVQ